MAILTGPEIARRRAMGDIVIEPFNPAQIREASYDVRLGPMLLMYVDDVLDMRKENPTYEVPIPPEGFILEPGEFYLGSTVEYINHGPFVPCIDGKSSAARLSISIHKTAGRGEPFFAGCWTLELSTSKRVRVYAGDKIGQVFFYEPQGEIVPYGGKYQHQRGPVASRSWMDVGE